MATDKCRQVAAVVVPKAILSSPRELGAMQLTVRLRSICATFCTGTWLSGERLKLLPLVNETVETVLSVYKIAAIDYVQAGKLRLRLWLH